MDGLNQKQDKRWQFLFSWISSLVFLPVLIYYIINHGQFTLLDYLDLLIHEGGHGIFRIFGEFIYFCGGTLMQMIIPSMFLIFYLVHKQKILFQLSLFWLGENLMNISVYAADARAHLLPLLGGNKVHHDWTYILNKLDIIEYDALVGDIFFYAGVVCFIFVFLAPLYIKQKEKTKDVELDLPL